MGIREAKAAFIAPFNRNLSALPLSKPSSPRGRSIGSDQRDVALATAILGSLASLWRFSTDLAVHAISSGLQRATGRSALELVVLSRKIRKRT